MNRSALALGRMSARTAHRALESGKTTGATGILVPRPVMGAQDSNRDARRLWLDPQLFRRRPTGPLDLADIIRPLGFVQLRHDPCCRPKRRSYPVEPQQNFPRADAEKSSRATGHRPSSISRTACSFDGILSDLAPPVPRRLVRKRCAAGMAIAACWMRMGRADILWPAIAAEAHQAPRRSTPRSRARREMWRRPPQNQAGARLQCGMQARLSTSHRENFTKYYDLNASRESRSACARQYTATRPKLTGCAARRWRAWLWARGRVCRLLGRRTCPK